MYRPRKRRGALSADRYITAFYGRGRYECHVCRIACTSRKQLEQHVQGIKHQRNICDPSHKGDENTFPLEHMVVLDQTEEDFPNDNPASPASCDSSDMETAASASDTIATSHMVILDETNDDYDHPASPASCDSSASESAPSSPATITTSDLTPKKKTRTEKPEDDQTAPMSPVSSGSSSNSAPEAESAHSTAKESTSKKHHSKSGKTRHKESRKTFHITPVKSNEDVFKLLKTFAVANESDVAFAEKVKELFSVALTKYKELKLEEIFCTEAEHSSPEELVGSSDNHNDHEQTNSFLPQATNTIEYERINSAAGSPVHSLPVQCISSPTSPADCQPNSPIRNQPNNPDTSSIASRSPTNICEDSDASNKLSATNPANDNPCAGTEVDLSMESDDCVAAEAACSDDEDV
ncbi:dentin sialophosphoprotein-like isoform X1 [Bufo bufo]|uniref:dentin sialophosphoprotein-like isoform X1 n=2 Tax=Bufo bufo TaxID=8384 RepID=UPI001ABDF9C5|nr:dentin sialophosphoprotein-like isoform X1 [Bufo bufo]XP_040288903.1 dentin sialophosphoprotein-like isoform X1 [Bufo bufo]